MSGAGAGAPVLLRLVGGGGEPVDLRRTIHSHGLAALPPFVPAADSRSLRLVTTADPGPPVTVEVAEDAPGWARVAPSGDRVLADVGRVLRLDEDLSGFYERAAGDPQLAWVTAGAGRLVRSPTVFEDVVKTICTTNCAWSATVRMVSAIVSHLGEPAVGGADRPPARAFPTPAAMLAAGPSFYADVARAGYRGRYLLSLAGDVAAGRVDLEAWARAGPDELPDEQLEARLRTLAGVGPYAAAHMLLLLGRYGHFVLDSWTRPTYARVSGRAADDAGIRRRFRRYGPWAGLAFWCVLTRHWVD
ncbi:MAG: Fe-S cluster assembly protein HesB [Actinobacteria bacterium]|nr:Fe-S cluster assembly protein HesB [Actinomycetota bacterium]